MELKNQSSFQLFFAKIDVQTSLIFLSALLVAANIMKYVRRPKNLPPGPKGVPVFGALLKMGKKPYKTVQEWWEEYGDIYSLYMGSRLCVVLNGVEVMKECLVDQSDTFNMRPWNYFKKLVKNKGIVFTDGIEWKEHRRFTLTCLRDFGVGKTSLEGKIHEEIKFLLNEIEIQNGRPFDPILLIPKSISNIICSIIYGSRFDYDNEIFEANIRALDQSVRNQTLLGLIQFLPFLEFLPKILPKDKLLAKNVKMRDDYAQDVLDSHKKKLDLQAPSTDFIDAYLLHMSKLQKKGEKTTFSDEHLHRTVQDLFIAGTETVNTTLKWSLLFMTVNPEIQNKVYTEIEHNIGNRFPKMADKINLPYTVATIMECQRLGNIALFSVPRCTSKDTVIKGYTIPKDTWVFVNRWGAHMNKRYWKDPQKFNPSRFLEEDGTSVKIPEAFIPFGMGPRKCLGEQLAKMELFLFFTSIMQHYKLVLPVNEQNPSLEPQAGINMSPFPYRICAVIR